MTIETRLAEIRARVEAATEGPWTAEYSGEQGNCVLPPGYRSTREAVAVTRLLSAQADAEFIAHSRTDLPALLAAVEAVREKCTLAIEEFEDPTYEANGYALGIAAASRAILTALTAALTQDTTREDPS